MSNSVPADNLPPLELASKLNPQQLEAVTHGEGPQLVLAGAGSGKTRVITHRVAWLIREQKVESYRIAAVTFTNKAAREMADRIDRLSGGRSEVFVGTFHRFALRLLRRYGDRVGLSRDFQILDSSDQKNLIKEALKDVGLAESAFPPRAVLSRISTAKNKLMTVADFERDAEGFFDQQVVGVYRRYQHLLNKVGGVDFDDLIAKAVLLLTTEEELGDRMRRRLRYLMVDEFQDTNFAQLGLIRSSIGEGGNLTAVGDEDQSIYRWRGAEMENILEFEDAFPGGVVRKLEQNYRSTQVILDASGGLVSRNEKRRGKTLWTEEGGGDLVELYRATDEGDEAKWLVRTLKSLNSDYLFRDMAILVRTNAQTRALEDELLRRRVPYCLIAGVRFYDRAEVKDLVAYLRVLRNPGDSHSLRRIINRPARGIGKSTQELVFQRADEFGGSIWDVLKLEQFQGLSARAQKSLLGFRELILDLRKAATERPLFELLEYLLERTGYLEAYKKKAEKDPEAEAKLENLREFLSAAQEFSDDFGQVDNPALEHLLTPQQVVQEAEGDDGQMLLSASSSGDAATEGSHGEDPFELDPDEPGLDDDALTMFLDYVSLVSDTDSLKTDLGVSVMTLHAAKGLEFPVVAVTGLEDGLLPHFNSQDSQDDLEEERRLLYVGMTRAGRRLVLTTCRRRRIAGRYQDQLESPFISEIPAELITFHESPSLFRSGYGNYRSQAPRSESRTRGVYSFFGRDDAPSEDAEFDQTANEPLESAEGGELRKGCRVEHATLGEGVVLELEGSGENTRLTVFFTKAGKRKLIAKYANLTVL